MTEPLLWLTALAPAALCAVGFIPHATDGAAARVARRVFAASLVAFGVAVATAGVIAWQGPLRTRTVGFGGMGLGLYVDTLTVVLFVLVAFVGAAVIRFAAHYVAGDPRHGYFMRLLGLTLAAVLLVIVSGNLCQFTLAWIATSVCLNRLLVFYPDRPAAVLAARKKFVASRLGDLCLLAAMGLFYQQVGSLDYAAIFERVRALQALETLPVPMHAIAILLVVAALLKSAQFPLHGWLTEVMETATPVSALLHAGIINAGGFLVLRFAGVIALSTPSLEILAMVGGVTAVFGSVVMLTQTSIKVSLAYSTIAQMGFMMLECGLGAFSAALLHIVAHSLYKAHAFLSSGSVIDLARASWSPSPGGPLHPVRVAIAIPCVLGVGAIVAALFGASLGEQPGVFALGAILLMGLAHLVANAIDGRPTAYIVGRSVALAAIVSAAYFSLQWGAARLLSGSLPSVAALRGALDLAIVLAVVVTFAAVTVLQNLIPRYTADPRWHALYVHLANGLYVNAWANRLAVTYWPSPPPRPATSRPALPVPTEAQ